MRDWLALRRKQYTTTEREVVQNKQFKLGWASARSRSSEFKCKERQPNKELLNLLPWKSIKTITISKYCARNIALARSKLKTYALSNYYIYTTNMWST